MREAVGEAAYAAGEYAEALAELRAAKRMNGVQDYVAIMADCERALGRPDRALALVRNAPKEKLVARAAGGADHRGGRCPARPRRARRRAAHPGDLALLSKSREPWVARLRYAYADALLDAGRPQDALTWFHRTEAVDGDQNTDAAERAAALEKSLERS